MKKVLFIAVLAVVSFASCKKDYTCTCVTTSSAAGSSASTDVETLNGVSKSAARANCMDATMVNNGVTYTQDCTLN